jgi:hypothetical protein
MTELGNDAHFGKLGLKLPLPPVDDDEQERVEAQTPSDDEPGTDYPDRDEAPDEDPQRSETES